jgi:hypothetical protein
MAKEWACMQEKDGFANKYKLNTQKLNVLDLDKHNILCWMAILAQNRDFKSSEVGEGGKEYLIQNFLIDVSDYDVIEGYRADDSYFAYAKQFVTNGLSVELLNTAMRLGNLGKQTVIITEKAFNNIVFDSAEAVDSKIYFPLWKARDEQARRDYRELIKSRDIREGIYIIDIMRNGLSLKDFDKGGT